MKNKKIIFIVSGIVSVIILIALIIGIVNIIKNGDKRSYKLEEIKEQKYFVINVGEKYGVIDSSGQILIEPEYEKIIIPNPAKDVFFVSSDYNSIKLRRRYYESYK